MLVFEDFHHWGNLKYMFIDHVSNQNNLKSTSVSHAFQESYNAFLATAIYDPHIFDTSLQVGLVYNQNRNQSDVESTSSNAATYQYHFSGVGLDRSPTPFTLLSYRDTSTIENTYTLPYTSTNSGNEFDISIQNDLLLSRFHFAHTTLDTRGGGYNSSSASNSYFYSAIHKYQDFSATSLQLRFSDQTGRSSSGAEVGRTSNYAAFSNTLSMGQQKDYSLLTSFQLDNSQTDTLPQRNIDFSESLQARLGKALTLEAIYTIANSTSTDFAGFSRETTLNRGEMTLKHKLYNSLETTLHGTASSNKMDGGTEDRYSGRLGIRYVKLLPKSSLLTVGVIKDYQHVDRKVDSAAASVIDELHSGVHQGDVIELPLGDGTLDRVVSVKSRNPEFTYTQGVDYTVNISLGRIDIQAGAGVRIDTTGAGMDLYISYIAIKAPRIEFSNNSFSVTSDLSLLKNKLHIGANYIESQLTLISGTDINNSLRGSRSVMVYASSKHDIFDYRISFRDVLSGGQAYRTVEGTGTANWSSGPSSFSLTARDRFNKYDAGAATVGYGENMAELSLSYFRNILSNMRLNLMANALDIRSDLKGTSDSVSIRAVYKIVLNKSVITMSGQSAWTLYNADVARDDTVQVDISRNF